MTARFIVGDALTELRKMPDHSVDLIMTSPPFLALRSYLPQDHPDKQKEIGSEATPGQYLDVLLDVVEECRRVLAPHGSLVVELGDTYSGVGGDNPWSGEGAGGAHRGGGGHQVRRQQTRGWPLDKSLTGIPQLFMLALTYGRNLLTGRELEPWRVRNFCPWVRPNPPVGQLGDKFRPATSYLTVACTSRDRYFDLDAVRTELKHDYHDYDRAPDSKFASKAGKVGEGPRMDRAIYNPAGAPPLDWFNIPTAPYKGAHYATYPSALVTPFVKAMCPSRVCKACGCPSERIVGEPEYPPTERYTGDGVNEFKSHQYRAGDMRLRGSRRREAPTLGWTDCGCVVKWEHKDDSHWRLGVVLDPFAGSGTTLAVATGHGRDAIGVDLDPRNAQLAQERCGMFLTVEDHRVDVQADTP